MIKKINVQQIRISKITCTPKRHLSFIYDLILFTPPVVSCKKKMTVENFYKSHL